MVSCAMPRGAASQPCSMRSHKRRAAIGEVLADPEGMVFIRTGFGGTRVVDMLIGDPLPRIC